MAMGRFEEQEHAELYSKYRPTYSDSLYKTIMTYYADDKDNELAVDVGCGSGQSTFPLANYFLRVIGLDMSAVQIDAAEKFDSKRILFRVGSAEDLSFLENGSVDLVTVAQAIYWFDRDVFFKEVRRVLKPSGILAVYGYGFPELDNIQAQPLLMEFYYDLLRKYWADGTAEAFNMYRDLHLPFPEISRHEGPDLAIHKRMSVDDLIGYLSTSSAWRLCLKDEPKSDFLQRARERLLQLYKPETGQKNPNLSVKWPGFLLIGRKPA